MYQYRGIQCIKLHARSLNRRRQSSVFAKSIQFANTWRRFRIIPDLGEMFPNFRSADLLKRNNSHRTIEIHNGYEGLYSIIIPIENTANISTMNNTRDGQLTWTIRNETVKPRDEGWRHRNLDRTNFGHLASEKFFISRFRSWYIAGKAKLYIHAQREERRLCSYIIHYFLPNICVILVMIKWGTFLNCL